MKNYKECSDAEFEAAMKTRRDIKCGTVKPEDVPTEQLFIIYTKMDADLFQLSGADGSYAIGLRISTRKSRDAAETELKRRNAFPKGGA